MMSGISLAGKRFLLTQADAYVRAVGAEVAPFNVQVNAIAQNFVDNPTYFQSVPLGRLVSAEEDASFAAYLCSAAADCFVGKVFPVSGGWAV